MVSYADIPELVCPVCKRARFPYLHTTGYLYARHPWCDPDEEDDDGLVFFDRRPPPEAPRASVCVPGGPGFHETTSIDVNV
jgi:hypothetical protein